MSKVKFYEFNDYEYYALIAVDEKEKYPMDVAIKAYAEEIEGGMEEYNENYEDSTPDEITLDEALERYKKGFIEECNTEASKIIDFYERIDFDKEQKYEILLISSDLC